MLEILSHQYLKSYINQHGSSWQNLYTFGRLVSLSLRKRENFLINSEIFLTTKCYPALLISLFLHKADSILVISEENIKILNNYFPVLEKIGFKFQIKSNVIFFSTHKIYFLTLHELIKQNKYFECSLQSIIFTDTKNFKVDLRNSLRISLEKKHWLENVENDSSMNSEIKDIYNQLKKNFFLRALPNKNYVFLYESEIKYFKNLFCKFSYLSARFLQLKNCFDYNWAAWVVLDFENFEWILNCEPLDELFEIKKLLNLNHIIYLSSLRKDVFHEHQLNRNYFKLDKVINIKSDFEEKKFSIYVPHRQMMPNNPEFLNSMIQKCNKLILLRKGFTVILFNDKTLMFRVATDLASKHGKNIVLESIPQNNQVLCSSYQWWLNNFQFCPTPNQIVIPLLPIPNMSEPFIQLSVSNKKKESKDWFREFLLPETFETLDRAIAPLRRNSGGLIILDGRINNRKWGRDILQMLQPSEVIPYIFPFN